MTVGASEDGQCIAGHMQPEHDGADYVVRRVTLTPGMCGGSLIFGQIGDWTWDTVGTACRTNIYRARNQSGQPTYLSFYYFHVRSEGSMHPHGLTFGDELDVTSTVFGIGSQSVLTLHRLSAAGRLRELGRLNPAEFYERPHPDCMYAANLNRWVTRSIPDSNKGLIESAPPDFQYQHLPLLPSVYSPRQITRDARENQSFYASGVPGFRLTVPTFTMTYEPDVVRDINAVGLMYFASYFAIADTALYGLWRILGRSSRNFLRRRVLDHKLGYFSNVDINSVLEIRVRLFRSTAIPQSEIADIAIWERTSRQLLAVAGIHILLEEAEWQNADTTNRPRDRR